MSAPENLPLVEPSKKLGGQRRAREEFDELKHDLQPDRSSPEATDVLLRVLKKHFESTFHELPQTNRVHLPTALDGQQSDSGQEAKPDSDDDQDQPEEDAGLPKIIIDTACTPGSHMEPLDSMDFKSFMSTKPPPLNPSTHPISHKNSGHRCRKRDDLEADNLKNDWALQKLLRESRLLEPAIGSSAVASKSKKFSEGMNHTGRVRHKAEDLHAMSLGAKLPASRERNVPFLKLKGIQRARQNREVQRRKEARENGIVLEKPKNPYKKVKRERGFGLGIGKPVRGGVVLKKRDILSIQGGSCSSHGRQRKGII